MLPPNPPYITATSPANGSTNVPLDMPFVITFSKPISPTLVVTSIKPSGIVYKATWPTPDKDVLYLNHTPFEHGTEVEFSIAGIDITGEQLTTRSIPTTLQFRVTTDNQPPIATIQVRGGDPTNVFPRDAVTVIFDEPVRPSSAECEFTPRHTACQLAWDKTSQSTTVIHQPLLQGQDYTFTIRDVVDVYGNKMTEPYTSTFTVGVIKDLYLPIILHSE